MTDAKKYTSRLAGQRVLIIGGSSGIGFGIAEGAIEEGAEVIISSSNAEKLQKSIDRLETSYPSVKGKVQGYTCDLSSTTNATNEVANLFSKVGTIDHVVYTAGDPLVVRSLEDWKLEDIQQTGMVRFFGPILVGQQLKKYLRGGPNSSYTLTSGNVAERPHDGWLITNGYMTGVYGLMRSFALELAPIRTNVVSPGGVETELWEPMKKSGNFEGFREKLIEGTTTGAIGSVEDVVQAYLYLMKDKNVSGAVIGTNSGCNLK